MDDIFDVVLYYFNSETFLPFLAKQGNTTIDEWRQIISTRELSETQRNESHVAALLFVSHVTSAVAHCQAYKGDLAPDRTTLGFTGLTQLDCCENSQESSTSSQGVYCVYSLKQVAKKTFFK